MTQQPKHISVPRLFESGNIIEWLSRFEICAKANGWDATVKAVKLPTLLEGEALAVWLDLTEEEQADYSVTVDKLRRKLAPSGFSSLEAFHTWKLQPGEALSLFVQDLKQKLLHAMPDISGPAREQLLLHQLLACLPLSISKQIRAAGDISRLDTAVEQARLLMALEVEQEDRPSMVAATSISGQHKQVEELKQQVKELTTQVASLVQQQRMPPSAQRPPTNLQHCFYYHQIGHLQRNCPKRRSANRRCFTCGQPGHVQKNCWQGNYGGAPMSGRGRPYYQ